jgi:poly(glycerol-phosphate) alpha-glucosyltransferase
MKIAILARWISRSFTGVFEVSRRFSQSIAELGQDDVRILGMVDEFTKADSMLWKPLDGGAFPARWGSFGYSPELTGDVLVYKPDVVHVHGIWTYTGVAAMRCAKAHGTPYMLSPHGMLDPWAVANSGWKKRLARVLYEEAVQSGAACMHAATEIELGDFRKYGRKNPVCVIPYGVDIPAASLRGPAPWQDVVPEGAKTILFMGRYHPKKGVLPLLQAWKQCNGENPRFKEDWHLILVGYDEGGHEGELRRFVESENLSNHVHFLPPQFGDARSGAYFNCDAFILPSFSEGLPTAVLLAWAHEKPVIITKHCNLNTAIDAGAGLLVQPEAKSIAKGLMEFAHMSTEDRETMGRRGFSLVQRTYVWSEVAKQLRDVYAWMQGGGEKPDSIV